MTKRTTGQLPDEVAESLGEAVEQVRRDEEFVALVEHVVERDREILDRLAQ
jgi:hypothetical protein